jgi:hypothetical protein
MLKFRPIGEKGHVHYLPSNCEVETNATSQNQMESFSKHKNVPMQSLFMFLELDYNHSKKHSKMVNLTEHHENGHIISHQMSSSNNKREVM